ncbi:MAG: arsenosugar biosynthesis radical SAM protein ArsS [Gemmatimonadota bacterium]|nr:MAG: arsenosugar biosynthesis radical SAM protein ArsS [Gemmatimonadota bacterium]
MNEFETKIADISSGGLYADDIDILQVNLGLMCNQECAHCHLSCSPRRGEMMEWSTMELILDVVKRVECQLVDLTGGSPELHPDFRRFVEILRAKDLPVQVRTNLTVLLEEGMEATPEFFKDNGVQLVASMPCYLEENVRAQRGEGVYERSVDAIRRLNTLGYGSEEHLPLNLVYNPGGPFLPPSQVGLEADYRRELKGRYGIIFSRLLTITNMPIGRFQIYLRKQGQDEEYLQLLKESYNPQTLEGLMCRHQISVGWDGTLYDCDFNLALGLSVDHGAPDRIENFRLPELLPRRIVTGIHCFGCTAGCGSSCGGALVN